MPTNITELKSLIATGKYNDFFDGLYGCACRSAQARRYTALLQRAQTLFSESDDVKIFSAPGRTELCGNHTDHNGGCVIAGSLSLDMIAAAAKADTVTLISDGYEPISFRLENLSPAEGDYGTTVSIIKGVLHFFKRHGYNTGGFKAYVSSDVLKGSGMSSSAAFEILICTILNDFYNGGKIGATELAVISQQAENVFFGKPCGLMDQLACACGGAVFIDFFEKDMPYVESISCDIINNSYSLCILDTGGNHTDLTDDYAQVTQDMRQISEYLGVNRLADTSKQELYRALPHMLSRVSHRAVLRAIHFFDENERVRTLANALKSGDIYTVCDMLNKSGDSSFEYLQNIYSPSDVAHQQIALALKLAKDFLNGGGACRVHGGGFAGTTLNLVPKQKTEDFKKYTESIFGSGSCHVLNIRNKGGMSIG